MSAWQFGNIVFDDFDVKVSKSQGVLDLPASLLSGTDWLDQDGKDYWQTDQKYNDREIILNCWSIQKNADRNSWLWLSQQRSRHTLDYNNFTPVDRPLTGRGRVENE